MWWSWCFELGNGDGGNLIDDDKCSLHRAKESVGLALEELDSAMYRVRISRVQCLGVWVFFL